MADVDLADALEKLEQRGWYAERAPAARRRLAGIARLRRLARGEPVYLAGDRPNGVFALVEGALDVAVARGGKEIYVGYRAEPGFWFGDLAVIARRPRLVSCYAAVDSTLLHLPDDALNALLDSDPALVRDFYLLSYRNIDTALALLANLSTMSSDRRVAERLLHHHDESADAEGWIELSQAELAEMVALSLPTLQRVLRRLARSGWVELGYGRMRVADPVGLRTYLESIR
ncbi:MAG: Crp/Fnr family transcriptional regulator [Geminicoccaceae bacterium]